MSDKKAAGQARKAASKASAQEKLDAEMARQEDLAWEDGAKKSNKKADAEAEKKARALERKAMATAQEEEENEELSRPKTGKGKSKEAKPKVSRAEIAARIMAEQEAAQKAEKKKKQEIIVSGGNDYMGELKANDNKLDDIDASGIDDAISALSVDSPTAGGKRVNLKAAYNAFAEQEMVKLKADNPGLKLSQYKELCFRNWQKSPENPLNI